MSTKDKIPKIIQDLIYAEDHHLLDHNVGRAAVNLIQHGISDDFIRDLIQHPVRKHKISQAFLGSFELPMLRHGDLVLGFDLQGNPIRFPTNYLNGHCLTIGGTGSGKTTKSKFLIVQVANKVKGLWSFDFVKSELGSLKSQLARLGINLLIVPARSIRINPLQCPEHVAPTDWAPKSADMLVHTFDLPPRATKLLHFTILEIYHELGILDGSENYPTLFDLRIKIASDADANHQAKHAILDALDTCLMSIGSVLKYRKGWNTEILARRHIVFKLGGIAETDKNLLLNSLLLPEFTSRVARGISNPKMDLWICCDEANRLISTNQSGAIADLIALVRGTGIGLDLSAQSADVVGSVVSNTANKFIGRCGAAFDYNAIGAAIGLNSDQRQWLNLNLRPGVFVGQLGEGNWRRPFIFKIPNAHVDVRSGDQPFIDEDLGDLVNLPIVEAKEFTDWRSTRSKPTRTVTATVSETTLSDAELRYLEAVVSNPGQPSSALPKLARISPKRAQIIRHQLVELGYLRIHRVSTGRRGRAAVVLEPLEPAIEALKGKAS